MRLSEKLDEVLGLCDAACAMVPSPEGIAAIEAAETAATDFVIEFRDELRQALRDSERLEMAMAECAHVKRVNNRLVKVLAGISLRCAPDDVITADGRTARFSPPDPEFYWRELSQKVKAVKDEMKAAFDAEDDAAMGRREGE